MTDFKDTSLFADVSRVLRSGPKPVHYTYDAKIVANEKTYDTLRVVSIDIEEDYVRQWAPDVTIAVEILAGTYAKKIFPYQDHLEVILTKKPLNEVDENDNPDFLIETERFNAILINKNNPIVEGNGSNTPSELALDITNSYTIYFQLINKTVDKLRVINYGQTFRNCTTYDVVKAIMTSESIKVAVDKGSKPIGVKMVKADNNEIRDHIIIPHGGIRLFDVPQYVHTKCGGIYNSGLAYYFWQNYWYIFPAFNTERYNEELRTLTVINVPPNKFPDIERTYNEEGDNVTILATGTVRLVDDTDANQLNSGNGTRFGNLERFVTQFASTAMNKAIVNRSLNNTEIVSELRKNGIQNVFINPEVNSANKLTKYSQLAERMGSVISLVWQNSNPKVIHPGMLARVLYLDGDVVKRVQGVVLKTQHFVQTKNKTITDKRHICYTGIAIYVKSPKD